LRQLESERARAKLYFLPEQLMAEVAKELERGRVRFVEAQVAIAIDLQLVLPLRPQNLSSLSWQHNFSEPNGPRGQLLLHIAARNTKTKRQDIVGEVPDEIARLGRRIDILLDAFASGALKGPSVQTKLEALEARQRKVAKQLAGLLDEPVRLHPSLAALYQHKITALQSLLENDATRTEAVEIIRSLVDQVIFRSTVEGGLEVELVGDIAQMVDFAQKSNENSPVSGAVHDAFARSVKVVAGARYQRYLPISEGWIPERALMPSPRPLPLHPRRAAPSRP
jgi:hypothetical protein